MNNSQWIIARNMSIAACAVLLLWIGSKFRASLDGAFLVIGVLGLFGGAFAFYVRGLGNSMQLSTRAKAAANLDSLRATIFINSSLFYAFAVITLMVQLANWNDFNGAYAWASIVGVILLPIANAYLRIRADSHQFDLGIEPHGDPVATRTPSPQQKRHG
ncbi:hypothetical protein [Planctomyces sp. SH-PL14]|uniref:hypothetical protein n=1 Tax=Planctomyces sp. SH-PL14 TaxID=1632864 RepID=UPI00078E01E2|nr:hypothetical protein [Planctomyces sp. SH-PL14]AMV18213.1 hypothetical protein VT03_10015 [Planctomyces sp. SH-PL14]